MDRNVTARHHARCRHVHAHAQPHVGSLHVSLKHSVHTQAQRETRDPTHTVVRSGLLSSVVQSTLSLPFALCEPPRLSSFLRYVASYGTRCSFFFCGLTFEYFFVFFFLFARFFGYGYFYVILFRTCGSYAFHATGDLDSPRCCLVFQQQWVSSPCRLVVLKLTELEVDPFVLSF